MSPLRFGSICSALGKLGAASVIAAALSATPAAATPMVDRQNGVSIDAAAPLCGGGCNWQQSITAGRTGQLTGLTLYGMGTGELRIGLGEEFVTGSWLAEIQGANVNGTTIDLRSYNIFLTAGQVFVADVHTLSDTVFGTENIFGEKLWFSNADWGMEGLPYDPSLSLAYTTYIDSGTDTDLPEPMSLALMAFGLATLVARRKA